MKAIVTGGAGFIGSHIVDRLLDDGYEVVVIDDLSTGKVENVHANVRKKRYRFINGDVTHPSRLPVSLLKGADEFYHLACQKCTLSEEHPARDLQVNAYGTLAMLELATHLGCKKFFHASTGSVNKGKPVSYYGISKLAGEGYVLNWRRRHPKITTVVLRYYHVYGPRQDSSFRGGVVPIFIWNAISNTRITVTGDGEQRRHFSYVGDVAEATVRYMQSGDSVLLDLINPTTYSVNDVAKRAIKLSGNYVKIEHVADRPGEIRVFSPEAPAGDMWVKTGFDSGFEYTYEWYKETYEKPLGH